MRDPITQLLNQDPLILQALREDISSEDVTTNAILPTSRPGQADLICKQEGVVAGLPVFARTFHLLDANTKITFFCQDGDYVQKGQKLALLEGDMRVLLTGERTALNYLQRMSGIATYTRKTAALLEGTNVKLLDTRKTTPNMRIFEKYAVRVGGGYNHRYNLSDGILIKDNHIGAAGADIIMLDNMDNDLLKQSIDYIAGRAEIEISGNVTKENIERIKNFGVNYVSSGALTHSAPILDISLKNLHAV